MVDSIPQAPDIERAILGTCLSDWTLYQDIREIISPDIFYLDRHKTIFEHCLKHEKPDMLLVSDSLQESGEIDNIGGSGYLADLLVEATVTPDKYCEILKEKKIKRDVIKSAQTLLQKVNDGDDCYSLMDDFSR